MFNPLKELEDRAHHEHFQLEVCLAHPSFYALNEVLAVHLAELRHFRELTGMDGIEFEKTLDETTGLKDWTGTPNGAMLREILAAKEHLAMVLDHEQGHGHCSPMYLCIGCRAKKEKKTE